MRGPCLPPSQPEAKVLMCGPRIWLRRLSFSPRDSRLGGPHLPGLCSPLCWASPFQAASSHRPSQWLEQWSGLAPSKAPVCASNRALMGRGESCPADRGLAWLGRSTRLPQTQLFPVPWASPLPVACPQAQSDHTSSPRSLAPGQGWGRQHPLSYSWGHTASAGLLMRMRGWGQGQSLPPITSAPSPHLVG